MYVKDNAAARCYFGMCHNPATRVLTVEAPLGGRIEPLCDAHAARSRELYTVIAEDPIPHDHDPRYVLTELGRAAIGLGAA